MNTSTPRIAVLIAATIGVTAIAAAAVTAAVTADDDLISQDDVDQLLAGQTEAPIPTWTWTDPDPGTGDHVATLVPGIVTVNCDGNLATLVSWSPNPGFRSDDPVRGPAAQVSVRFESDTFADYKVTATCANGTPTVVPGPDDDHGGGDDDGGGDDHGGGNRGPGGGD